MRTSALVLISSFMLLALLCRSPAFAQSEGGGDEAASTEGAGTEGAGTEDAAPGPTPPAAADSSAAASEGGSASGAKKPISAALLLGYGIHLGSAPNPWGFGFGLRGGYNLDQLYLGARFVYSLGQTERIGNLGGGNADVTIRNFELGVEGGYDLSVADKLVIRPLVGLGLTFFHFEESIAFAVGGKASDTSAKLFVAPGAAAMYDVTPDIFVGLDARLIFILGAKNSRGNSSTVTGLSLLLNGGMRF